MLIGSSTEFTREIIGTGISGIQLMRHNYLIAIYVSLFATIAASGQTPALPSTTSGINSNPATNLPMQRLGPEDLISLAVYDSPEFSLSVRIASNGTIRMPMLKETIKVQGLFPNEAETAVADALRRENLLVDPFVTVTVAEYHSRPINVIGAVRAPTIFQAVGSVTLLDALARAGGVTDSAGPTIIVTRPNGSSDVQSVQRIPTKALIEGSEPELNIPLTGGESIRVPDVAKIIVEGSVNHPGVFPVLDPISTNTVTSAIAQAAGLAQYADHTAFIYRTDEQGVKHEIKVKLWDILQRKKPDVLLQAKDTLYIPDSPKRRITQNTINSLTGVGTSAATTAIITARP
jgi:polysaccharide biosynthesis/export protein